MELLAQRKGQEGDSKRKRQRAGIARIRCYAFIIFALIQFYTGGRASWSSESAQGDFQSEFSSGPRRVQGCTQGRCNGRSERRTETFEPTQKGNCQIRQTSKSSWQQKTAMGSIQGKPSQTPQARTDQIRQRLSRDQRSHREGAERFGSNRAGNLHRTRRRGGLLGPARGRQRAAKAARRNTKAECSFPRKTSADGTTAPSCTDVCSQCNADTANHRRQTIWSNLAPSTQRCEASGESESKRRETSTYSQSSRRDGKTGESTGSRTKSTTGIPRKRHQYSVMNLAIDGAREVADPAIQEQETHFDLRLVSHLDRFRKVFRFLRVYFWDKMPSVNDYPGLDGYLIVTIEGILNLVFGHQFQLVTRCEAALTYGTGLHPLIMHDISLCFTNPAPLRPQSWPISFDFDPKFVKALRTTGISWLSSLILFGAWYLCGYLKKRIFAWWNKRIGSCRFCQNRRLKLARHKTPDIRTMRVMIMLWLMTSAPLLDAAKVEGYNGRPTVDIESPSGIKNVHEKGRYHQTSCNIMQTPWVNRSVDDPTHEYTCCIHDPMSGFGSLPCGRPTYNPGRYSQKEGNSQGIDQFHITLYESFGVVQNGNSPEIANTKNIFDEEDHFDVTSFMHAPIPDDANDESPNPTMRYPSGPSSLDGSPLERDRGESNSEEEIDALVVFGLEIDPNLIPLIEPASPEEHRIRVAEHFGIDPNSGQGRTISTFFVRPRPPDLAQCITPIVALFSGQLAKESAAVLVDIELNPEQDTDCDLFGGEAIHSRETWKVPESLNRASFLHFIGVTELCLDPYKPCTVLYGMQLWNADNVIPFPIFDGLYLQVRVTIVRPIMPLIMYREYARRGIRLEQMASEWTAQTRRVKPRLTPPDESDDEELLRAAIHAEQHDEHDFSSLLAGPDRTLQAVRTVEPHTLLIFSRILGNHPVQIDPAIPSNHFRSVIGDAMDITRQTRTWDNFLVFRVVPPPQGIDALFQEPYILALPEEIAPENSFVLVDIHYQIDEEFCLQPSENVRAVYRVATRLNRVTFLQGIEVYEMCVLSGNDRCDVQLPEVMWHNWEFRSKYLSDGMYIRVQVPVEFPDIPLNQQREASRRGMSAQQMIYQWSRPHDLNLLQQSVSVHAHHLDDESALMQRPDVALRHCDCLHLPDPRWEWDWQEIHGIYGNEIIWVQVWFAPLIPHVLHTNVGLFNWNTRLCLRCMLQARTDIPVWQTAVGPYFIRPQPGYGGIANAHQYVLLQQPVPADMMVVIHSLHTKWWADQRSFDCAAPQWCGTHGAFIWWCYSYKPL